MTHFVYTVKWHIGNVFNKPPRQNAPTDRLLTSVILKGIKWAFRKVYPTKIPGMVHQGLLAPQSLKVAVPKGEGITALFHRNKVSKTSGRIFKNDGRRMGLRTCRSNFFSGKAI